MKSPSLPFDASWSSGRIERPNVVSVASCRSGNDGGPRIGGGSDGSDGKKKPSALTSTSTGLCSKEKPTFPLTNPKTLTVAVPDTLSTGPANSSGTPPIFTTSWSTSPKLVSPFRFSACFQSNGSAACDDCAVAAVALVLAARGVSRRDRGRDREAEVGDARDDRRAPTWASSAIHRRESVAGEIGAGGDRIASATDAPVTRGGRVRVAHERVHVREAEREQRGIGQRGVVRGDVVVFIDSTVPPPETKSSRSVRSSPSRGSSACAVIWSENAGTPRPATAPRACQSSFGSVVAAPVAVVTWFTCTESRR